MQGNFHKIITKVCPHCNTEQSGTVSVVANHIRWCKPKQDNFGIKKARLVSCDHQFGLVEDHSKICETCGGDFVWVGRKRTKAYERARFCSRSCAAKVGARIHADNIRCTTHYRYICFEHNDKKCLICGFSEMIVVHHLDENHENDDVFHLYGI